MMVTEKNKQYHREYSSKRRLRGGVEFDQTRAKNSCH